MLASIAFDSKDAVHKTVAQLRATPKKPLSYERKTNHSGKFQFNVKDAQGNVIGNSQLYGSEAGMENGIKNLKRSIASLVF